MTHSLAHSPSVSCGGVLWLIIRESSTRMQYIGSNKQ